MLRNLRVPQEPFGYVCLVCYTNLAVACMWHTSTYQTLPQAELFDPTCMDVRGYVMRELDLLGEQLRERVAGTHPGSLQVCGSFYF